MYLGMGSLGVCHSGGAILILYLSPTPDPRLVSQVAATKNIERAPRAPIDTTKIPSSLSSSFDNYTSASTARWQKLSKGLETGRSRTYRGTQARIVIDSLNPRASCSQKTPYPLPALLEFPKKLFSLDFPLIFSLLFPLTCGFSPISACLSMVQLGDAFTLSTWSLTL